MNLRGKKKLIARKLRVGIDKIILDENRLGEIKEAITRQDIVDLANKGLIRIREARGSRKKEKSGCGKMLLCSK